MGGFRWGLPACLKARTGAPSPPRTLAHARTHRAPRSSPAPHLAAKTFEAIEAEKDARTPSQDEWLRRAETTIPIGQPPSSAAAAARAAKA